jgi:uncharacterized membrane protein
MDDITIIYLVSIAPDLGTYSIDSVWSTKETAEAYLAVAGFNEPVGDITGWWRSPATKCLATIREFVLNGKLTHQIAEMEHLIEMSRPEVNKDIKE